MIQRGARREREYEGTDARDEEEEERGRGRREGHWRRRAGHDDQLKRGTDKRGEGGTEEKRG